MESVAFIQWCLDHLNYWTVTILMTIESSFIPFPSEIVIPPAAYKAAATGELHVVLIIVFGTIGATIGALINYTIAYYLGRPLVYKFANSRLGHVCLIDVQKVRNAETYFDNHGALSTFIGRYRLGGRNLEFHLSDHRLLFGIRRSRRSIVRCRDAIQSSNRLRFYRRWRGYRRVSYI